MADIGRILFLPPQLQAAAPPSTASGRSNALAPAETVARGAVAGVDGDATASAGGRSKQFRFRVYDGSKPDEALAGDSGLPTKRAGVSRDEAASGGTARLGAPSGERPEGLAGGGSGAGLATPSSAFLAQLIAQEQLRPGLYDPPLRDADRAYRRAGGEPALSDETGASARARFKLAV